MAQLLSADLLPELDFPSEFPYEVPSDTSNDDDSVYLDYNLFFPRLSLRRLNHSSIFNGLPTRRHTKYSSSQCDGIPLVKKLSDSPNSTLGGTDNRSAPGGVSELPHPSLVLFRSSDVDGLDLAHAATALQLERLKVAPERPQFGTCHQEESSPFRHLPEQHQLPSYLHRDPFSLPCFGQSSMPRNAREVDFIKQNHDTVLLAQQRQLQVQAQVRAKKLGFVESSNAVPLQNRSGSTHVCAGTGGPMPEQR